MNLDKDLIETALRNHGHSYTVQRVVSMESELALAKGENYLSVIYRITLKVILGNGRPAKKSLILKVVPPEEGKTSVAKDMGAFKSETRMYSTVLREMEMLMEEFGDSNEVLWCQLVHYMPYNYILLEDLKTSGFKMAKRRDLLDLDHTLLVLRSLGRFHAMAKILETRGITSKDDYKPYGLFFDKTLVQKLIYNLLLTLAKAMEMYWDPEWYDIAQMLKKIPCEMFTEIFADLGKLNENSFNCVNHGDCWSNNMMFKYDWQNRPYSIRFVDYAESHYNSIGVDVERVLYNAIHPSLRKPNLNTLLSTYHSSLQDTLKFYGYEGKIPTLDWVHLELERLAFAGHMEVIWKFISCSDNPVTFDMDLFVHSNGAEGIDLDAYKCEYVRSLAEEDIKSLANLYIPAVCKKFRTLVPNQ